MIQLKKSSSLLLTVAIIVLASCTDTPKKEANTPPETSENVLIPLPISYNILHEYPHDPTAFTEGLEFRDGVLYESTGQYGVSDVRKTDPVTGKILASTKMEAHYFGEGLTILNGKLYQLTYKEGKGFIYDLTTLKKEGTFSFPTQEGWGMTNNGNQLIYCDGGSTLYFADPVSSTIVKQLAVTDEHGPVRQINELEMINGFIYANQWKQDIILKIDTGTGKVVARADLNDLRQKTGIPPLSANEKGPEVLNGIAYDAATNRIFITGKNWPKLFEIRLDN